ncbi:MAG: LamG domain-containing protein [Armatimonadetes bacterium]|nr:LamG domain-containing protein [Armatimonadota bacterium]
MSHPAPSALLDSLTRHLHFYASFDSEVRADRGAGTRLPRTRFDHPQQNGVYEHQDGFDSTVFRIAPNRGIVGGALEATDTLPRRGRIYFPAAGNLPFSPDGWNGTLSFWLLGDPNLLLKGSFSDPVQITHRGSGDGGLWVDFNNNTPRDLRAGAFPARTAEQPGFEESDAEAPLIVVPGLAWPGWRHVALTWENLDSGAANASVTLYLDGQPAGSLQDRKLSMAWDLTQTGIYVAVGYMGLLDELAIVDRALSATEIAELHAAPDLIARAHQVSPGMLH